MINVRLGINSRGLGAALCKHRKDAQLTLDHIADKLGTSASTICRIETGKREPTPEEVSAILAIVGVVGLERERLLCLARGRSSGLVEVTNPTSQSRTFGFLENYASTITSFQPLLVPGLAQTANYAYAVMSSIQVDEESEAIEDRVRRRLARQSILGRRNPPQLNLIIGEHALRTPVGGAKVMASQVRHLVELARLDHLSIRVVPSSVGMHPGYMGQFLILDFAKDPTVVFIEARTTGLFRDDPEEVNLYRLTAERLRKLAVDESGSIELMRTIAADFDGG